ncbi:MAG: iron-containing alcohol dehydrogenase [Pseudomonadota bacterium]
MADFIFRTTPWLEIGAGRVSRLGGMVADLAARSVLLVVDPGVRALGLTAEAERALADAGLAAQIWDGVAPDPTEPAVLAAVAAAGAARADAVVGLGGGSAMDTAKMVALLAGSGARPADCYGVDRAPGRRLPLVLVPTTAGSGSEVTPIAVVRVPGTAAVAEKTGVVAPQLLPDAAILDATLTVTLPASVTAASGIDAMSHAIEAYNSAGKNPLSDMLAVRALAMLRTGLPRAVAVPDDLTAREAMLVGSALAGMASANAPVGAGHALSYPLGQRHGIAHGHAIAAILAPMMAFNRADPGAEAAFADLAPALCPSVEGQAPTARVDALIDAFAALGPDLGLETRLSALGVEQAGLDALAADAQRQRRLLANNPRPVSHDEARALYEAAW